MNNKSTKEITLLDISLISPIEGHSKKRVKWLADKILTEGVWTVPIKVEKSLNLLMDGHHRFEVAKLLKLKKIPVEIYEYDEIEVYSLRDNIIVSQDKIFENHKLGIIYPYKTAKHNFINENIDFKGVSINELR